MDPWKSLDEVNLIAALLRDVSTLHGAVFNSSAQKNTLRKVFSRTSKEGLSFLTKTLPRLGKAFDKALTGTPLNAISLGLKPMPDSELPMFMGELFSLVLDKNGTVLPEPCTKSVRTLRQILYLFYKYELPYNTEQTTAVVDKFVKTDQQLLSINDEFSKLNTSVTNDITQTVRLRRSNTTNRTRVIREARILLERLFASFDPMNIHPRHGPGAVSTKETLWEKYQWTNVSANITQVYPLDQYFYCSLGHLCDDLEGYRSLSDVDHPARVVLVPKDSRGPRLISCEPVDYQWIQQGLGRAIVQHVEHHPLTRFNVFFTDQSPNQCGALLGSATGKYSTLDLNEASDRVSTGLVELLFPPHIVRCLMACRSCGTVLPSGEYLKLNKFAPMGSCLCFPVMALTIWAILTASIGPDREHWLGESNSRLGSNGLYREANTESVLLVYGDDVIVPTAKATDAIEQLESFGLKVNRDKSCTSGLFRESCGTDAFKGVNVTPVRLRTVWSSKPSPESYSSWVAYANSFLERGFSNVYDYIVERLVRIYGPIPTREQIGLSAPSLIRESECERTLRRRSNRSLQKLQYYVWTVKSPRRHHYLGGWSMLLRYFAEGIGSPRLVTSHTLEKVDLFDSFPVSAQYTERRSSILVRASSRSS